MVEDKVLSYELEEGLGWVVNRVWLIRFRADNFPM